MTKIVAISDSHGHHWDLDIPECDILVCAGDISRGHSSVSQLQDFNNWIDTVNCKHKILVPGNHDRVFENKPEKARDLMTNCTLLMDEEIVIDNIKFYGSPWQPFFFNWAFNLPRGEKLAEKWAMIPNDTDVLITHGPPYGVLDQNDIGEHCGCVDLLNRIDVVRPKINIFGHIHEDFGTRSVSDIIFANVSVCDERYILKNKPTIIEYIW